MGKGKENATQPKIGLDIFSGAGGLSLGAEMAGIDVKYAIEINKSAAQTFRKIIKEQRLSVMILPNYRQKRLLAIIRFLLLWAVPRAKAFPCQIP